MPLRIGETFAGYRIVRLLGSGGMGEVYLAERPRLPRRDAIKILTADVSAYLDYRARFIREADLAEDIARLSAVRSFTSSRSYSARDPKTPIIIRSAAVDESMPSVVDTKVTPRAVKHLRSQG